MYLSINLCMLLKPCENQYVLGFYLSLFLNWQSRLKVFEEINGPRFDQTISDALWGKVYFSVSVWTFSSPIFV